MLWAFPMAIVIGMVGGTAGFFALEGGNPFVDKAEATEN